MFCLVNKTAGHHGTKVILSNPPPFSLKDPLTDKSFSPAASRETGGGVMQGVAIEREGARVATEKVGRGGDRERWG